MATLGYYLGRCFLGYRIIWVIGLFGYLGYRVMWVIGLLGYRVIKGRWAREAREPTLHTHTGKDKIFLRIFLPLPQLL